MDRPVLKIEEQDENGEVRLGLCGELDLLNVIAFEDRLNDLAAQKRSVRLDLSRLEFIDSTGLRVLIRALVNSRDDGWRLDVEPSFTPAVLRVLQLVNLHQYLVGKNGQGWPSPIMACGQGGRSLS